MKKKTSPLTLNVKAEGYAMNAQLICEDSQGNKVELTSKGINRINLGMVRITDKITDKNLTKMCHCLKIIIQDVSVAVTTFFD